VYCTECVRLAVVGQMREISRVLYRVCETGSGGPDAWDMLRIVTLCYDVS
jgi:hypothetical protein